MDGEQLSLPLGIHFETAMGSVQKSSESEESDGQQMKQYWLTWRKMARLAVQNIPATKV